MHESVLDWISAEVRRSRLEGPTVEIGSLDVNGSARPYFNGPYVGFDLRDGPGVDVVASGHELPIEDASAEVVVCTEVLEHDPAFWLTLAEVRRILRPGGRLLLTTRGNGFGEHREPVDLWRFMPDSIPLLAELAGCVVDRWALDPQVPGVFLSGLRKA